MDALNAIEQARYIVASNDRGDVDACWRLLPTQGPNMLRDVFPELLHGQPAPCAADVWELSRFAIATDRVSADDGAANPQIGFGALSVALMAESTRFAQQNGIARFVTVTTAAIERMLKKQGLNIHRLGPPLRVGHVLTVATFIEIDHITLKALADSHARERSVQSGLSRKLATPTAWPARPARPARADHRDARLVHSSSRARDRAACAISGLPAAFICCAAG